MAVDCFARPNIKSGGVFSVNRVYMWRIVLRSQKIHTNHDSVEPCKCRHLISFHYMNDITVS